MFWMAAAILVFPWLLGVVISYTVVGHSPPAGDRPYRGANGIVEGRRPP